ncbi:tetrapyrrole methylase [Chytriomyces cf. hyalinus JEL632]|nr:tetrapyrrole methylase [Chytriomyces cf. hyalinus JEL632]
MPIGGIDPPTFALQVQRSTTELNGLPTDRPEALYGKKIPLADREMVESDLNAILKDADSINAAATTHTDLVLRAKELDIRVTSIHNASIMNAIGCCGLQLYNYSQTISIVFCSDSWRPDSFYDKIKQNRAIKLHALCLLDIKVKEQSIENMARGRKIYEPPRYMTVNQAVEQLLEVEEKRQEKVYSATTIGVGMSRIGAPDQRIICGTLQELLEADFGEPLHSLVLAGEMHFLEADILKTFAIIFDTFNQYAQVSDH